MKKETMDIFGQLPEKCFPLKEGLYLGILAKLILTKLTKNVFSDHCAPQKKNKLHMVHMSVIKIGFQNFKNPNQSILGKNM